MGNGIGFAIRDALTIRSDDHECRRWRDHVPFLGKPHSYEAVSVSPDLVCCAVRINQSHRCAPLNPCSFSDEPRQKTHSPWPGLRFVELRNRQFIAERHSDFTELAAASICPRPTSPTRLFLQWRYSRYRSMNVAIAIHEPFQERLLRCSLLLFLPKARGYMTGILDSQTVRTCHHKGKA